MLLDPRGYVASCNATNLFWVQRGVVHTSSDDYCFNGVTRANVITLCRAGFASLVRGDHLPASLATCDEAFVTGTMGGVTPIRSIDGRMLPAVNGSVTRTIAAAYSDLKDADAAAHSLV